jgi:hypothetical protein
LKLIPVPADDKLLDGLFPYWSQFLPSIARRTKQTIEVLIAQVARHEVQPVIVWDESREQAVALLGVRYHHRGADLIAELVWLAGKGMAQWRHLIADLERYLKEHEGVAEVRPICRPGWAPFLKQHGYHITHYTLEKRL